MLLKATVNAAKPRLDIKPIISPYNDPLKALAYIIIKAPINAIIIVIKFCFEIFSLINTRAINDAKKGINANINRVTAAVVLLIE